MSLCFKFYTFCKFPERLKLSERSWCGQWLQKNENSCINGFKTCSITSTFWVELHAAVIIMALTCTCVLVCVCGNETRPLFLLNWASRRHTLIISTAGTGDRPSGGGEEEEEEGAQTEVITHKHRKVWQTLINQTNKHWPSTSRSTRNHKHQIYPRLAPQSPPARRRERHDDTRRQTALPPGAAAAFSTNETADI